MGRTTAAPSKACTSWELFGKNQLIIGLIPCLGLGRSPRGTPACPGAKKALMTKVISIMERSMHGRNAHYYTLKKRACLMGFPTTQTTRRTRSEPDLQILILA